MTLRRGCWSKAGGCFECLAQVLQRGKPSPNRYLLLQQYNLRGGTTQRTVRLCTVTMKSTIAPCAKRAFVCLPFVVIQLPGWSGHTLLELPQHLLLYLLPPHLHPELSVTPRAYKASQSSDGCSGYTDNADSYAESGAVTQISQVYVCSFGAVLSGLCLNPKCSEASCMYAWSIMEDSYTCLPCPLQQVAEHD